MLQAIFDKETSEIRIIGEFFELDQIYFMNERLAGTYGAEKECLLEGYENAASLLKGLNYEIRHAERGDRELCVGYNGISSDWFAPTGTPDAQILKEEDQNDPDEIINEIEDAIVLDLDIDLDEFYDMDEDEQREVLEELFVDENDMDVYFAWLHKERTWPFRFEDYPGASDNNTYLQFRIRFMEGLLYALVYRDLLSKKKEFIEKSMQQAKENKNGLGVYGVYFCRFRMPAELLLAEMMMVNILNCVYEAVGKENYDALEAAMPETGFLKGMDDAGVKKAEAAVMNTVGTDLESVMRFFDGL